MTCIFSHCKFYFVLIVSTKPKNLFLSEKPSKNALWVKLIRSKFQNAKEEKNSWVETICQKLKTSFFERPQRENFENM